SLSGSDALDEELQGLPVPVRALAEDALGDKVGDDGVAPPLLASLDVREVNFDDRRVEQLERIADRVRVVRPRAGVDDHAVGPVVRVVTPLDVLALAIGLP